jgi:putative ABC transport system permease protein
MTDFTIIRRSMLSRLFSTVTTIATVAVAVGLMLVLLSMRDAARRAFERGSGNMHLLVSRDASPLESVLNGVFYARPPQRPIDFAKFSEIASIPPLGKSDDPRLDDGFAIPVQQGDSYRGFATLATTREFFEKFRPAATQPWKLAAGRFFEKELEIVLGARAARGTGLKLGDRVSLTHGSGGSRGGGGTHEHDEFKFEVVGILEPSGSAHDRAVFTDLNSAWLLHAFDKREAAEREAGGAAPDEHASEESHADDEHHGGEGGDEAPLTLADLTDADRLITGIYIRAQTRKGSEASPVMQSISDMLRRDTSITVASPSDQIRKLFQIVGSIDQVFLAMAAAVMVSSGIAIMLALYNSMEQRRRQIAVLRVLGSSRGRIFGLVVTESALLGALGAAAGLLLSLIGALIVARVMKQRLGLIIEPAFAPEMVLAVLLGTIILAAAAGLVPAIMAYRTSVAKNLRPIG